MAASKAGAWSAVNHAADNAYMLPTMEVIHVQVHDQDAARLRELASVNDRSLSAEVRRAIRVYLADPSAAAQAAPIAGQLSMA